MNRKYSQVPDEPSAHGKKLSHWLRRLDVSASETDHQLAAAAVREIGPAAIPHLLTALQRGGRDAERAARGFGALGESAAAAVPEIARNPGPEPQFAGCALGWIGAAAFEALVSFLEHEDPMVRSAGAEGISDLVLHKRITPEPASTCLPQLILNMEHYHRNARSRAASAIGMSRTDPDRCVPSLLRLLNDEDGLVVCDAVHALGDFGKASAAALPKLLRLIRSRYGPLRVECVDTLSKLGLPEGYEAVGTDAYSQIASVPGGL